MDKIFKMFLENKKKFPDALILIPFEDALFAFHTDAYAVSSVLNTEIKQNIEHNRYSNLPFTWFYYKDNDNLKRLHVLKMRCNIIAPTINI